MMNAYWNAAAAAIVFFWCGAVAAISFLEAWIKFTAPGVTMPVGLSIGQEPPASSVHLLFVAAEVVKAGSLVLGGIGFLKLV